MVVTDIRMPPTSTDEGIRLAARAARDASRDRRRRAQPVRRARLRARAARAGSEGRAYLLKERVHDRGQLRGGDRGGRRRRLGHRPQDRRAAGRRQAARRALAAGRRSPRASARSWPRSPRARATPRSPRRSSSPSAPSRSTSTRSSSSSTSPTARTSASASRRRCSSSPRPTRRPPPECRHPAFPQGASLQRRPRARDAGRMAVRVGVADDSFLIRRRSRACSATATRSSSSPCARTATSWRRRSTACHPDVVLVDIRMPPTMTDEGIRLAAQLRSDPSRDRRHRDERPFRPGLRAGAAGGRLGGRAYLLKDRLHSRAQLLATIETVAAGGSVIDPKVVEALVRAHAAGAVAARRPHASRARDPRGDGSWSEQRGDRGDPGPDEARRREAHQLGVRQARPAALRRRQPSRARGPPVPRRHRPRSSYARHDSRRPVG